MNKFLSIVTLIVILQFKLGNGYDIKAKLSKFINKNSIISFTRIFRGYPAFSGQFAFYAGIETQKLTENTYGHCGGTLISDQWVITAAHCLNNTKRLAVYLGTSSADDPFGLGRKNFRLDKDAIHIYPGYSSAYAWNDIGIYLKNIEFVYICWTVSHINFTSIRIALIQLPEKVQFTQKIHAVHLPTECMPPATSDVIAVGKGAKGNHGPISQEINFAAMKIISLNKCRSESTGLPTIFFRRGIFCARNNHNLQNLCEGDSGGPLISRIENTLIGVASFGHPGNLL